MAMYKIIGADGRQYGPVADEQLRQWISEGRANAQTQTLGEGATIWRPLGAVPEFSGYFVPPAPPTIRPPSYSVRKTNSFAMAGFIFGILAILCCCKLLFGTLGIVFSLIGLSQINQQPQFYEGRGIAIAGLVLSILSLLLAFIIVMLAMASGNFHYWNFHRY